MKVDGEGDEGGAAKVRRGLDPFFGVMSRWGGEAAKPPGLSQPQLSPPGVPGLCQLRRGAGERGTGELNMPALALLAPIAAFRAPEPSNAATSAGKLVWRR